jgi:glycosyltransferase involved in cell wall biosynthesis
MLSVIIPSRSPQYLQQTIDDLLLKAEGEIEIIVILDGYWPDPMIKEDKKVIILHHGTVHENPGMRESINAGVAISKGDYIMKIDEHCMVDQGYDVKLIADCQDDWVVVPRRYRLDPEKWELIEDGRPPVDYMTLDYPYQRPHDKTCGLHGAEHREMHFARKDVLIDDLMTMQGSCYFMTRKHWDNCIKALDSENYGPFTQEAQEICNKTWFSGGRCIVNKKTWYAHWHKGNKGKGYGFSNAQYEEHMKGTEKGRRYCIDYWMSTKDYKYDFDWLLNKFWPVPTWPDNWKEQILIDKENDYANTHNRS